MAFDELNVVCNKPSVERHAENVNTETEMRWKKCVLEKRERESERWNENEWAAKPKINFFRFTWQNMNNKIGKFIVRCINAHRAYDIAYRGSPSLVRISSMDK